MGRQLRPAQLMRDSDTRRLVSGIRRPLGLVRDCLSADFSRIHSSWRKLLGPLDPGGEHLALLTELDLGPQVQALLAPRGRVDLEVPQRQGQDLARRGVPAENATAALGLYLECCLPYVMVEDGGKAEPARALARFASIYQLLLLSGYATHAAQERESLEAKFSRAEQRLQGFSAQLGDAYEKERRRLAQDLHDEIGHDLIVLKLYTEMMALDLKRGDVSHLHRKLKEAITLIKHALKGVRHLTFDLGPAVWHEQGFVPAVRLYARQFSRRTGLKVRLEARRLHLAMPPRCETALYKVLQGALSNVVAHAGARNVKITLSSERDTVTMRVEDDGRGFDVRSKLRAPPQSFGLRAMRERIELLGGAIRFVSRPTRRRTDRQGTAIEVQLPLHDGEGV
jgi:signal transduction histidine kinase